MTTSEANSMNPIKYTNVDKIGIYLQEFSLFLVLLAGLHRPLFYWKEFSRCIIQQKSD